VFGRVLEGLELLQRIGRHSRASAAALALQPLRLGGVGDSGWCWSYRPLRVQGGLGTLKPITVAPPADREAGSADGEPRVDVVIADCGVVS
jgi:hypothetical protein